MLESGERETLSRAVCDCVGTLVNDRMIVGDEVPVTLPELDDDSDDVIV